MLKRSKVIAAAAMVAIGGCGGGEDDIGVGADRTSSTTEEPPSGEPAVVYDPSRELRYEDGRALDEVHAVAFSPGGTLLAAGGRADGEEGAVVVWDVDGDDRPLATLVHESAVSSIAFSEAGDVLASGSIDGTVTLWSLGTEQEIGALEHDHPVLAVALSADGTLAAGTVSVETVEVEGRELPVDEGSLELWDAASQEHLATLDDRPIRAVAFSSDGQVLAAAHEFPRDQGPVQLWNPSTRELDGSLGEDPEQRPARAAVVGSLAFSPDGTWLVGGGLAPVVWDMRSRGHADYLESSNDTVVAVDVSPGGDVVVAASGRGPDEGGDIRCHVLDAEVPQHLCSSPHPEGVNAVAFSPDDEAFASGGVDGSVWLHIAHETRIVT